MIAIFILLVCLAPLSLALVWALSANDITNDGARRLTRRQRRNLGRNKADLRVALKRKS